MPVTRMVHVCELAGFMPVEMLYEVAPQGLGKRPKIYWN
jgi:hypothetical protein